MEENVWVWRFEGAESEEVMTWTSIGGEQGERAYICTPCLEWFQGGSAARSSGLAWKYIYTPLVLTCSFASLPDSHEGAKESESNRQKGRRIGHRDA